MAGKSREIVLIGICLISFYAALHSQTAIKQVTDVPTSFCVSEAEWKLYKMINEYRRQYDLPPIPLSKSLCFVANTHVKDLFFYHPDKDPCNFHSWSDKGPWKPFCYPGDEDKKNSVWDKPKELTKYPGKGFEIVYWENNSVIIDSVISFWRSFDYFNSFLMNTGKWQGKQWNAIGIGICENYAAAWFGELADTEGPPGVCGKEITNSTQNLPAIKTSQLIRGTYYIIVKSQLPLKEAEKVVQDLQAKGYKDAKLFDSDSKIRVSIFEDTDREKAIQKLKEAKVIYQDAWLFKP
ncbi:MAG: SPOR domain-containing protein [bacterium]